MTEDPCALPDASQRHWKTAAHRPQKSWPKSDDDQATSNECDSSPERFILCRSRERSKKEEGITQRFEKKIEEALTRMKTRCEKQARDPHPLCLKTH